MVDTDFITDIGEPQDLPKDVEAHHWTAAAVSTGENRPRGFKPRPRPKKPSPRPGRPNAPPGKKRPGHYQKPCRRSPADNCPDDKPKNDDWWDEDDELDQPGHQGKGVTRISELDEQLAKFGKGDDPKDKSGVPDLKEGYKLKPETPAVKRLSDSDDRLLVSDIIAKDLGLDPNTKFRGAWSQATRVPDDPKAKVEIEPVSENFISVRGGEGVVICKWNDFYKNNITPPGKKHDWWSDHFVQLLKRFRDGESLDDIKYVVRDSITAPGTQNMMAKVVKEMPAQFQKREGGVEYGTFSYGANIPDERKWFETMMGTVNAKGVARALQDYPNTFGKKRVTKIHLWYKQPDGFGEDWDEIMEMALELGV